MFFSSYRPDDSLSRPDVFFCSYGPDECCSLCEPDVFFLFSKAKLARKMLTVGKRSRVAPGWLPSDYQLKNSSGKYKSRSLVAKQI